MSIFKTVPLRSLIGTVVAVGMLAYIAYTSSSLKGIFPYESQFAFPKKAILLTRLTE